MNRILKILHLEDTSDDADLVQRELRKASMNVEVLQVDEKEVFTKALDDFRPDVVLSDHSLPSFNSQEALRIVRAHGLFVPFILVTATVSEEYAVRVLQEGADDYILKDRLQRLPAAISNALERYAVEEERRNAITALRNSEHKYRLLFDHNPLPMWMIASETQEIIAVNEAAIERYGYTEKEFLDMNLSGLRFPGDTEPFLKEPAESSQNAAELGVWRHRKKDGTPNVYQPHRARYRV
ncbi:MAG: response regulator [Chitinophagaceae bacterium]